MNSTKKTDALLYHSEGRPGKIQVIPTKPHTTQRDLGLAYSPGVAEPCLKIEKNPQDAYKYTTKGQFGGSNLKWNCGSGVGRYWCFSRKTRNGRERPFIQNFCRHRCFRY